MRNSSTNSSTPSPSNTGSSLGRALLFLIGTTGFEVAGLVLWLELDAQAMPSLALLFLFIGLVLERFVVKGIPHQIEDWIGIVATSSWEHAVWVVWLVLIQKGVNPILVLALLLLPGLHFQHAFLTSFKSDKSFSELVRNPGFIFFSLVETVGAGLWLAAFTNPAVPRVTAHLIILAAIAIEHFLQGLVLDSLNHQGKLKQMGAAN
jgi:hypothetical protein